MIFYTKLKGVLLFTLVNCAVCFTAMGQNNMLSLASSVPAAWTPVDIGVKPGNNTVTITAGDTVSLDGTATAAKLTIQKGAILNSITNAADGNSYSLQAGSGTAGSLDTLENDGIFGSASGGNDGIALAPPSTCTNIRLLGTGVTAIGAIQPSAPNSKLLFILSQNATLNNAATAFSALPDSSAVTDTITFNIDTNKTLKLINPTAQLQTSEQGGGSYTYNINGTLDATATTDTLNFTPTFSNASVTTVNVNGKLKLGSAFNSVLNDNRANALPPGNIVFNIADAALVDATLTSYLNMGNNYFSTYGTGVLKRNVGNTDVVFPIGAPGLTTFSPVVLNNKGTATNFNVSVKSQFDNPVPNSNKVVNRQWTITPDSVGVANVTVSPEWLIADQAAGFNPASGVSVINYNGTAWAPTAATVSGQGTATAPYEASAPGFTTFGLFAVASTDVKLATKLNVYPNPATGVVNLSFPQVSSDGTISIITSTGRKMLSADVGSGAKLWNTDISAWPSGVYIITLNDGGKKSSAKLIKL